MPPKIMQTPMMVQTDTMFIQGHLKVLGRFPAFQKIHLGPNLILLEYLL